MQVRAPSFHGPRGVRRTAVFNVATTGVSAVTGILIARFLGPKGRGDYAAVTSFFGISCVVFEVGLSTAVVYFVARRPQLQRMYVRMATTLLLPLALVAMVTAVLVGHFAYSGNAALQAPFGLLTLTIFCTFIGTAPLFGLQSVSLTKWNIVRLAQPASYLVLVLGAEYVTRLTVSVAVTLLTMSVAVQSLLAWSLFGTTARKQSDGRLPKRAVSEMLRYGALNAASSAPNVFNSRLDQVLLAFLVSSAALGRYAVAVSVSLIAAPIVAAFGHVALPSLARGNGSTSAVNSLVKSALRVSIVSSGVIVGLGYLAIPVVFGSGYAQAAVLLLFLAPGSAVVTVNMVLGNVLKGLGHPLPVAIAEWVGVACTVVGILLAVPHWGVTAAAAIASVAYTVTFLLLRSAVLRTLDHRRVSVIEQVE